MSTMYISPEILSRCLYTLEGYDYTANGGKYQELGLVEFGGRNTIVRLGFPKSNGVIVTYNKNNKEFDGLYRWFRLLSVKNQKAIREMYPDDEDMCEFDSFRKVINPQKLSIIELIKHLEAIQYNLDEYPDRELDDMVRKLKDIYIHQTDEYKKAEWG